MSPLQQPLKTFTLLALLACFSVNLFAFMRVEPVLYFGTVVSNPFQAKGDFYDPIKGHTGIDLPMKEGTPLSIPTPLRVVDIREQNEMGTTLYTEDAWGNVLVFSHLNEILFELGSVIKADAVFAFSGNTGTATTGPHLHFEIIAPQAQKGYEEMTRTLGNYKGYNIDPSAYLLEL